MSDISEFLLAQIAADEQAALSIRESIAANMRRGGTYGAFDPPGLDDQCIALDGVTAMKPARVLAQCAAFRAIVEAHRPRPFEDDPRFWCSTCDEGIGGFWPCITLRALGAIYADHPDYREEWRL